MGRAVRHLARPGGRCPVVLAVALLLPACGAKSASTSGSSTGGTTGAGTTLAGSATGAATTGQIPLACRNDRDCMVVNDCCSCTVVPQDEPAPPCPAVECAATACDGMGFFDPQAVCFGGVCRFREVGCDPALAFCDAPPPDCPEGWLPRVEDGCWQECVPVEACDTVPGCDWCTEGEVCVTVTDLAGTRTDCEPLPVGCDPADPCACTPAFCPLGLECLVAVGGRVKCNCGLC